MNRAIRLVAPDYEERIDLASLMDTVWTYRRLIVLTMLACGIAATAYALLVTPRYKAEVSLTEAHDGNLGGAASVGGQLSGLASLAGINLSPESAAGREARAVLHSRHLIEEFIKRNTLENVLLAGGTKQPTLWRAVERFRGDVVAITDDKRNSTTIVTITWTDPDTAARWANGFVGLANDLLRTRALDDASRNIDYLQRQIAKTNVVEMQRVMYSLIETQTKTLMLANARAEYAFAVVDPAVPSEIRASPHRTLIVLGGILGGFVLGLMAALIRQRLARNRDLRAALPEAARGAIA